MLILADGKKRTILIVDDDPSILRVFTLALQINNFNVITAENGKEAMSKIKDGHIIDVALVDFRLPDMNGLSLLENMQDNLRDSVKLIITGLSTFNEKNELAGIADGYITKPIKLKELLTIIDEQLIKKSKN